MLLPLIKDYFWLNCTWSCFISMSVINMIHIISSSLVKERFPFTWKADVSPFVGGWLVCRAIHVAPVWCTVALWWVLISTVNHELTESLRWHLFSCFAHFHGYGRYCATWITHVGEKTMTCGKYLVLYMPQYTVYEWEVWCMWMFSLLTWHWQWRNYSHIGACFFLFFFACGLACEVGWLDENDYRAADVMVSCKLCYCNLLMWSMFF